MRTINKQCYDDPKQNTVAFLLQRSAKQCRERWTLSLDPSISTAPWTAVEDTKLMEAQAKLGNKWSKISSLLKGRTENNVKNRFNSLKRRENKVWHKDEDALLLAQVAQLGVFKIDQIAAGINAKFKKNRTKTAVKKRYAQIRVTATLPFSVDTQEKTQPTSNSTPSQSNSTPSQSNSTPSQSNSTPTQIQLGKGGTR